MSYKYVEWFKNAFCVLLLLCLIATQAVTGNEGEDWFSPLRDFESDFFIELGGLKANEIYEVYYDGYFAGMQRSNIFGRVTLPLLHGDREIEVKEYLRSAFSVESWHLYDE